LGLDKNNQHFGLFILICLRTAYGSQSKGLRITEGLHPGVASDGYIPLNGRILSVGLAARWAFTATMDIFCAFGLARIWNIRANLQSPLDWLLAASGGMG